MYGAVKGCLFVIEIFECPVEVDEDQWMYDNIMSKEVDMNEQNENEAGVNEKYVDCSDEFNTSQAINMIYCY